MKRIINIVCIILLIPFGLTYLSLLIISFLCWNLVLIPFHLLNIITSSSIKEWWDNTKLINFYIKGERDERKNIFREVP